jgi:serine/threonine protein kinase/Flp pilus assembly protein TadD
MSERSVFFALLDIADPAERLAYLEQACAGDPALRVQVEKLLKAHEEPGPFMDGPAAAMAATDETRIESPGTVIGPYKLLEQIGEGGFGVVFMAEQQHPVRRKVALKVLKPSMNSRHVVARFEAERQALALMDHPHIAHVLDGGETAGGRPYFVMELVRGFPITDFCDQNQLPVRERLGLFIDVCQAVQHAHQKGIIHRDLKPGNLLVTLHDGVPVVKVIDFGIAKALGQQLTEKTLFTSFAQLIGTPIYMSPEQAEMSGLDVDTRSDIYALGVLLYELLTGTTPFDAERLRQAGYDEIRRIIREEEPPQPSKRLSRLGKTLTAVSALRATDPHRLSQLFRGELDWIVMKALEKDRNRRYETAGAFAADVQRYLNDEPVQACPPSRWYRFRKTVRRNKGAFVTASALILAVLLTVVGLAASNVLIRQEQARTREEKDRAEKAQKLAEVRAEENRQALERLKAANGLLDRGRWYVTQVQWDDAHAAFTKAVELRPDHASGWVELGELHALLGLWDLANEDWARAFDLQQPETTMRWYRHALLRLYLGDVDGYRQLCRGMRQRFGGTLHPHFAGELVRTCVLGPDPGADLGPLADLGQTLVAGRRTWYELYLLGIAQHRAGHPEEAVRLLRESLTTPPDWTSRALNYPVLAMAHHRLGQTAEARQALDEAAGALDGWTSQMYHAQGPNPWVGQVGASGSWPLAWWDWLECQLYYREARVLIEGAPPPPDVRLHVLRARALAGLRSPRRAEAEYAEALKLCPNDPQVQMEAHRARSHCAVERGRWDEAAAEFALASELRPDEAYLWCYRALAHLRAGDTAAYRRTCAELVERFEKTEDSYTACHVVLACVVRPDGLPDTVRLLPLAEVAARTRHFGTWLRGAALYRAGKYEEAVRSFETQAVTYRPRAWDWCFLAMAHHRLRHAAEARRCLAEAARWIDDASREGLDDPAGTGPSWGSWCERVVYPLLLREAEERLGDG